MHCHLSVGSIHLTRKSLLNSRSKLLSFLSPIELSLVRGHMGLPSFLPRKRMGGSECVLIIDYSMHKLGMMSSHYLELMNCYLGWMGLGSFQS